MLTALLFIHAFISIESGRERGSIVGAQLTAASATNETLQERLQRSKARIRLDDD